MPILSAVLWPLLSPLLFIRPPHRRRAALRTLLLLLAQQVPTQYATPDRHRLPARAMLGSTIKPLVGQNILGQSLTPLRLAAIVSGLLSRRELQNQITRLVSPYVTHIQTVLVSTTLVTIALFSVLLPAQYQAPPTSEVCIPSRTRQALPQPPQQRVPQCHLPLCYQQTPSRRLVQEVLEKNIPTFLVCNTRSRAIRTLLVVILGHYSQQVHLLRASRNAIILQAASRYSGTCSTTRAT